MERIKTATDCHNLAHQLLEQSSSMQLPPNVEISVTLRTHEFEQFKKDIGVSIFAPINQFKYHGVAGIVFKIIEE